MFPKFIEGFSLVIGLCVCMYALFNSDAGVRSESSAAGQPRSRGNVPARVKAAYLLVGCSLLVYGLAEVIWRSAS